MTGRRTSELYHANRRRLLRPYALRSIAKPVKAPVSDTVVRTTSGT
ncbi:MAG: hypothetical protein ACOCT0_04360 [Halobacteriota archaeon]